MDDLRCSNSPEIEEPWIFDDLYVQMNLKDYDYPGLPVESADEVFSGCWIVYHSGDRFSFLYRVDSGGEIVCHFSMLCEVGQYWKRLYEIALTGIRHEVVELEESPYFIHRRIYDQPRQ